MANKDIYIVGVRTSAIKLRENKSVGVPYANEPAYLCIDDFE